MRNSIYYAVIALALFAVMAAGCKPKSRADGENNIQFDSIRVEKMYHLQNNPEYPNCELQINFMYPVKYADKEILAAMRKQFVSSCFGDIFEHLSPEEAVEEYAKLYLEDYKSLEEEFGKDMEEYEDFPLSASFMYFENSSTEITYNKNNLLGYSVHLESYTGGAHGSYSTMNYVINLENGTVITEEDIFIDDFQEKLAQILVDKITSQNNVKNPKELETVGFFSIDEIFPNGNFALNDEGITYYFNPYEIAAYVVGITTVELPYREIKHLLRRESPIAGLI